VNTIDERLKQVLRRISAAEQRYGRAAGSVRLLAVSKTWPLEEILAAAAAGQHRFGENYVREAIAKVDGCRAIPAHPQLEWHFIGRLQSNKSRDIADRFDWVHSVDSLKLARRLSEQRPATMAPLNICLQVNISGETSKSGVEPDALANLTAEVATLPRIKLRGLMAIPAPLNDFEQQRAVFQRVRELQQQLNDKGMDLDTLSMGMSDDLEAAIAEGATIVRVGTAIFGARDYP
jgi:pyridoxal phosphate enzyme (YggS family)